MIFRLPPPSTSLDHAAMTTPHHTILYPCAQHGQCQEIAVQIITAIKDTYKLLDIFLGTKMQLADQKTWKATESKVLEAHLFSISFGGPKCVAGVHFEKSNDDAHFLLFLHYKPKRQLFMRPLPSKPPTLSDVDAISWFLYMASSSLLPAWCLRTHWNPSYIPHVVTRRRQATELFAPPLLSGITPSMPDHLSGKGCQEWIFIWLLCQFKRT